MAWFTEWVLLLAKWTVVLLRAVITTLLLFPARRSYIRSLFLPSVTVTRFTPWTPWNRDSGACPTRFRPAITAVQAPLLLMLVPRRSTSAIPLFLRSRSRPITRSFPVAWSFLGIRQFPRWQMWFRPATNSTQLRAELIKSLLAKLLLPRATFRMLCLLWPRVRQALSAACPTQFLRASAKM